MERFYFAFGSDDEFGRFIIVTPRDLWDREQVLDDGGQEATDAIGKHGLPLDELAESIYETDRSDDEIRTLLTDLGAVENPDMAS